LEKLVAKVRKNCRIVVVPRITSNGTSQISALFPIAGYQNGKERGVVQYPALHNLVSPQESPIPSTMKPPAALIEWQNACTKAAGGGCGGGVINNFLCINKGKMLTLTLTKLMTETRTN